MSQKQFKASFFQKMLDDENADNSRHANNYEEQMKGTPPEQEVLTLMKDVYVAASKPLKKMQMAVLKEQSETCYPDKWMSDSFSNAEQIELCKQEVYDKHWGPFDTKVDNLRESSHFRFQDCEKKAGNNMFEFVHCFRNYKDHIKADNEHIVEYLNQK